MSDFTAESANALPRTGTITDLYRAVWRWHFYAGLFVLPFLITLSITGGLYLFRNEIDGIVHADLKHVEMPAGASPPSRAAWSMQRSPPIPARPSNIPTPSRRTPPPK